MKIDMSLSELLNEANAVTHDVQSTFGKLTAEQLNWKPNPDSWSVAQCLDHLITINGPMLAGISLASSDAKSTRLIERLPFWSGLCGRMMVKALVPGGTQKFKAPPTGQPSASKLDPQIVSQFAAHQQNVAEKIKEVESRGLANVVMTSPFMSLITYSLLDACRIIVVHERRHFEQARRVMAAEGFPT
ncbi:MAG TPA: DinB family protein [Blastocatellia bacterium]|nr:DinB family protein [Blastocatellia bacterium]